MVVVTTEADDPEPRVKVNVVSSTVVLTSTPSLDVESAAIAALLVMAGVVAAATSALTVVDVVTSATRVLIVVEVVELANVSPPAVMLLLEAGGEVVTASTCALVVVVEVEVVQSAHDSDVVFVAVEAEEVEIAATSALAVVVEFVMEVDVEKVVVEEVDEVEADMTAATWLLVVVIVVDEDDEVLATPTLVVVDEVAVRLVTEVLEVVVEEVSAATEVVVVVMAALLIDEVIVVLMLVLTSSTIKLELVVGDQSDQVVSLLYWRLKTMPSGRAEAWANVKEATSKATVLNCIALLVRLLFCVLSNGTCQRCRSLFLAGSTHGRPTSNVSENKRVTGLGGYR